MYKTLTENEISRLDVSSALSYREQIYATFHNAECSRKLWGEGKSVFVFPRLTADIQKKGKPASLNIQTGVLWAQNSSQEIHVCENSAMRFSCIADFACTALLHLCIQLSLQA